MRADTAFWRDSKRNKNASATSGETGDQKILSSSSFGSVMDVGQ